MSNATDKLSEAEARMRTLLEAGASALLVRPDARSATQADHLAFLLDRVQRLFKFAETRKDLRWSRRLFAILTDDARRRAQVIELIMRDHQIEYLMSLDEYRQNKDLPAWRTKNAESARSVIKAGPVRLM